MDQQPQPQWYEGADWRNFKPLPNTHDPDDSFCFYCQKQYASPQRLRTHVFKQHPGTIKAWDYVDKEREANLKTVDYAS